MADVILIPGLWLAASSWDGVVPVLERAGHRPHALTLAGMESRDADRAGITLRDHVDAVVAAIDAAEPGAIVEPDGERVRGCGAHGDHVLAGLAPHIGKAVTGFDRLSTTVDPVAAPDPGS